MDFIAILETLKEYDLPTIIIGIFVWHKLNKKLNIVDKAVNQRSPESLTLSEEVSEIHKKVDVSIVKTDYLVKEMDLHRGSTEAKFLQVTADIKGLHKRVTNVYKKNVSK
tara:strand:+ start:114 stop:443 length:330 start_codon:yes stop_codon:yes gene_type:complete